MSSTSQVTIYSQALGRDFAIIVDEVRNDSTVTAYAIWAADGDGNLCFEVAAVGAEQGALIFDRIDSLIAEARERMTVWQKYTGGGADWMSWPNPKDDWDTTPGPIPDGRLLAWVAPETAIEAIR